MTPVATVCGHCVEWVRSCFQSAWRLTDDPSVLTPGRYVFAPDDTPHWPGWHSLGCKNWSTADYAVGEPLKGEDRSFRRKWASGAPPVPFPSAIAIGPIDQIGTAAVMDNFCDWRFSAENGAAWSLNSQGPRLTIENSLNCGGTNALQQSGTAATEFVTSIERSLRITLRARVERQNANYDIGQVYYDGVVVALVGGQGDLLGCVMEDVDDGQVLNVTPGVHTLEVTGDTVDGQYHVGCFFQLDFAFDPPFPPDNREFYAGFNALCYVLPAAEAFELLTTPDIFATASQLDLARIMVLLYDDPPAAAVALVALLGPTSTATVVPNDASLIPGTVIGVRPDLTVVVIAGTSNVTQAATYTLFSGVGPIELGPYETNAVWKIASSVVATRVTAAGADPTGRIIIVGHSYGGAVAMLLSADYLWVNNARLVDCLTFGACKPGDQRLADLLRLGRNVRISNAGDPVPSLPPAFSQILGYLTVLPASLILNWRPLVQPAGQLVLNEDGTIEETDASTMSLLYLIAVVASVTTGPPLVLPFAHSMVAYVQRLGARLQLPPQ